MALYALVAGIAGLFQTIKTDLDVFFLPSAQLALAGHPLFAYAVRYHTVAATYANANGPLSLVPLVIVAWIAQRFGWLNDLRLEHLVITATFSLFSLLMAREAVLAIDRLRGRPLTGVRRPAAYAALAASPLLWLSLVGYGHIEQPIEVGMILFAVRGLVGNRPGRAGLGLGLAVLARTSAVVYAVPLVLVVLARRGPGPAARMLAAAVSTVTLGLVPFLIADQADVAFSLVTSHGDLPVGLGSIWRLTAGTPFEQLAQHADTLFVLLAALVISLGVLLTQRDLAVDGADLYGFLSLVGVCFPLLAKTVWSYYFFEPAVFATVWWLARPGWRRLWAWSPTAFLTGCAVIAEAATDTTNSVAAVGESLLMAGLLSAFILVFGSRLAARSTT